MEAPLIFKMRPIRAPSFLILTVAFNKNLKSCRLLEWVSLTKTLKACQCGSFVILPTLKREQIV